MFVSITSSTVVSLADVTGRDSTLVWLIGDPADNSVFAILVSFLLLAVDDRILELVTLEVTDGTSTSAAVLLAGVSVMDAVISDVTVLALIVSNTENGTVVTSSDWKLAVAACSELAKVVAISAVIAALFIMLLILERDCYNCRSCIFQYVF